MFALRFLTISTLLSSVLCRAFLPDKVTRPNTVQNWTIGTQSTPSPSFVQFNQKHLEPKAKDDSDDVNCYCDHLCPAYNDCCRDLPLNFKRSTDMVRLPAEVVTCRRFSPRNNFDSDDLANDDIYVVSRCPNSYGVEYIRESCEMSESSLELFHRVPVNGNRSGILYGNVYCAICNGEPEVVFWTVRRSLDTENATEWHHTFLNPKGRTVRVCSCDENEAGHTEKEECPDRSQPSLYSYEYREFDLAINQPYQVCEANHSKSGFLAKSSGDEHGGKRYKAIVPYSILFDLNSKSITATENLMNGEPNHSTIDIMRDCGEGMMFDPFAEVCHQIYCKSGFVLTRDGCVLVNGTYDSSDKEYHVHPNETFPELLFNCTQFIRLNDSEFSMLSNESAFVRGIGSSYRPEEYHHSPPYLYICSDLVDEPLRNATTNTIPVFNFDEVQSIISFVGILISLVALFVHFVIYMRFPILRNTPGKCVVCLILSIFCGQLSFLFVSNTGSALCRYLAAFTHFSILASFLWTNVLALDISRTFASKMVRFRTGSGSNRFLFYSVYAWFVPATIVGIGLVMDALSLGVSFRPYYGGEGICWITSRLGLVVFFLVPVAVILLSNFLLYGLTVFCLCRSSRASEPALERSRSRGQLVLYIRLSAIMGLTWVFGFVATLTQWTAMWYLFILFNTLQGAFLCLAFVCTKNVLHLMNCRKTLNNRSSLSSKNRTRDTSCQAHDLSIRKTLIDAVLRDKHERVED